MKSVSSRPRWSLLALIVLLAALVLYSVARPTINTLSSQPSRYAYRLNPDGKTCTIVSYEGPVVRSRLFPLRLKIPDALDGVPVTAIGDGVFANCDTLTKVDIPKGVTAIGNSAFIGCSALPSVSFPDSVVVIGDSAFRGCTSLTNVDLPEHLASIGSNAFDDIKGLRAIVVPASVEFIGTDAFYYSGQDLMPVVLVIRNSYAHVWASRYHISYGFQQPAP